MFEKTFKIDLYLRSNEWHVKAPTVESIDCCNAFETLQYTITINLGPDLLDNALLATGNGVDSENGYYGSPRT